MAKYGAPLFVDVMSGKIGGIVMTKARSGPTIRVRAIPSNPNTAAQAAARAALVTSARAYKNLSTSDAQEWRDYADGLSFPNGVGGQFAPSGISAFVQLAAVFLAVDPTGTPPSTPPATAYEGDTIAVTGSGGVGQVSFDPSAANTAGSTTELLYAPLKSVNRVAPNNAFKTAEYHVFTGALDVVDVTLSPGYYSLAYRFVKIATGQRGPLVVLGTFQVT